MESNKNLSNLDIKVLSDIFHHLNEINQSCNLLRESFLNIAMAKVSESALFFREYTKYLKKLKNAKHFSFRQSCKIPKTAKIKKKFIEI